MSKRKNISPTQSPIPHFLPARKQSLHPLTKRPKVNEAGCHPSISSDPNCESTSCSSIPSSSDLVTVLGLIDEVILFAGKPLLWSQIQEEVYSLHKRSTELAHLRLILGVSETFYRIETGYRKSPHGEYKSEYKLSIPDSEYHDRASRFQNALKNLSCLSEYTLPSLPAKPPSLPVSGKKALVIKSLPSPKPAPPISIEKPISVFLSPQKTSSSIATRKSEFLNRIRAKASQQHSTARTKETTAAWDRGEWAISSLFMYPSTLVTPTDFRILGAHPGKSRVAVSLKTTVGQMVMSSNIPVSDDLVRQVVKTVCGSVPWFCRIIKLRGDECMSSKDEEKGKYMRIGGGITGGKENQSQRGKEVEGLLIYAKREGMLIGREEVLKEFRSKRAEWEKQVE